MSMLQGFLSKMRHLKTDSQRVPVFTEREFVGVLPSDAIMSITDPVLTSGEEAKKQMSPAEAVLGLDNEGLRAYPVNILTVHQIINDNGDRIKVAATW